MTKVPKWVELDGSTGFTITWIILIISNLIILFYDIKLAIMGALISIAFGFLGFDMLTSLCEKKKRHKR